ncbi:MAG: hypothetical protein B6U72_03850 [Candidatus Altiarchaeales archaeon ex4484_2]|nr:MAG: hypothetical protein B6U72_03850 [Candidatus Altiarchaeales archaeon ex4484_2]
MKTRGRQYVSQQRTLKKAYHPLWIGYSRNPLPYPILHEDKMGSSYKQKNKKLWATTLSYMLLIYVLSSISHPPQPVVNPHAPMLEHIIEYSILGFLLHALISSTRDCTRARVFVLAVLLASLYGLTDEIHQFFVPGRICGLEDLVADTLGALIGSFISFLRLNPAPDSQRS